MRLLSGGRLFDPAVGLDEVADLLSDDDGRIAAVGADASEAAGAAGADVLDCAGCVVMPGLVDAHTHLREPGREDEEDVESGSRAAARGGFTAVCAMPNTEPPPDSGSGIRFLLERAEDVAVVRVHPLGTLTKGREGRELAEIGDMIAEGAVAFSDDGDGVASARVMRRVMEYASRFDAVVVSHPEDAGLAAGGVVNEGVVSTRLGLPGIPVEAEELAVERDIALARLTGCRLHLAHLSTARSVDHVRRAKAEGLAVTCEVTPHHLFLCEDDLVGYDTHMKMNPPLRTAEDRDALVEGLVDGTVDCIATDHAPHAPHEKEAEFEEAPFGTTGLETALALVVTELVRREVLEWGDVVRLMADGPRRALRLTDVRLERGATADLTVVDPDVEWSVEAGGFESRSRNSAFIGRKLTGAARHVLVGGALALRGGEVVTRD